MTLFADLSNIQAAKWNLAITLFLGLGTRNLFADVVRLQPVIAGQAAPSINTNISAPQTVNIGSVTVTAQASLVQNLTLVRVNIKNGSDKVIAISPHLFSAADGDLMMLKLMESSNVTSILQADLAAIQAQQASLINSQQPSGPDPFAQSISAYIFGRMGMKGDARNIAATVATGVIQNMNREPAISLLPPPDITPGMVARESLESSDLDPGYSTEGIVFFTVPKTMPLTIRVTINGKRLSMAFDAPVISPLQDQASLRKPGEETSVESSSVAQLFYGMSPTELLNNIVSAGGKCNAPNQESATSAVLYLDCQLANTMIVASNQGGLFDTVLGTSNQKVSVSQGAWTWIFRNDKLVNHKATILQYR